MKTIKNFFKELFKDDLGTYDPKAKKVGFKWSLYLIIGFILSFLIPCIMFFIEVGIKIAQGIDLEIIKKVSYRTLYFIFGIAANVFFVLAGYLTTKRINGDRERLRSKRMCKFGFCACFIISIICYIAALLLY